MRRPGSSWIPVTGVYKTLKLFPQISHRSPVIARLPHLISDVVSSCYQLPDVIVIVQTLRPCAPTDTVDQLSEFLFIKLILCIVANALVPLIITCSS
jgi:hypothetical protein